MFYVYTFVYYCLYNIVYKNNIGMQYAVFLSTCNKIFCLRYTDTHLSINTQMQTIMYDWNVPMDTMSTSCSRLNIVDNIPLTIK